MTHFLQSEAWSAFQTTLGRTVVSNSGQGWSYKAYLENGRFNTRLYSPYGPVFTSEATLASALSSLVAEGKRHKATFVRIEPTQPISREIIKKFHVKPVTYQHLQPQSTQIISLSAPEETLLSNMAQNTRNIIRNYQKKGLSVRTSHSPSDLPILLTLLKRVAQRTGLHAHNDDYFQRQAETLLTTKAAVLYIISRENTPVAAALFYDSPETRYYAHAAADDAYRKLQPGTALLGQAILDAKREGKQAVDLFGIAPANQPNHPWAGFTRFKQSFGGAPVSYGGAWDIPLKPFAYHVYRLYQSIYQKLR